MSDSYLPKDLKFIRIVSPHLVPRYLLEQTRELGCSVDHWFESMSAAMVSTNAYGQPVINKNIHLYALVTARNEIRGVLSSEINQRDNMLFIEVFSIDKKYWHKGEAMQVAADYVKEIVDEYNLDGAYWLTRSPKHSEKYGFRRSKRVLMEQRKGDYGRQSETSRDIDESTGESDGSTESVDSGVGRPGDREPGDASTTAEC